MASIPHQRPYDLVLYGATGYLGSLVAQYLSANAPTTLKWAISGRNASKLSEILKSLNKDPDRPQPDALIASLEPKDLDQMAAQTRLVVNTVGPFCKYGTAVVQACVDNSTHYVDSTGEHVWANEILTKFHDRALAQNSIIIPQCAVESSPPDLMCYLLAQCISKQRDSQTGAVSFSIYHTWPGLSGGMIPSIFAGLETYSLSQTNAASATLASCVKEAGPYRPYPTSKLPVRRDSFLGPLAFNPSAMADRAVIMRTWSLLQRYGQGNERYGERFSFSGYSRASSLLQGWLSLVGMSMAIVVVFVFPPIKYLLRWLAPASGTGPKVSDDDKHFVEWRAVAQADGNGAGVGDKAIGIMRTEIDVFSCCALLISEAALVLNHQLQPSELPRGQPSLAMRLRGGVLTPASLGWDYIERLERAGVSMRVEMMKDSDLSSTVSPQMEKGL